MTVGKPRGEERTLPRCNEYPPSLAPPGWPRGGIFRLRTAAAIVASIGVFVVTSRGHEYRRRAQACLDAAHAMENEQTRAALLRLAEDWLRMAESWDDPTWAAAEQAQPIVQQQQQVQPKDDDNKE
jgi:hypothetical protein